MESPALTVVIPVFDEEAALVATLDEWLLALDRLLPRGAGASYEVILVDDGSRDGTPALLAAYAKDDIRVACHAHNLGYGRALKTALALARAPWILTVDADGTYPADALPALWHLREHADMVIGARRHEPDPLKSIVKRALFELAARLAGRPVPDLNTGLRLVRRDLLHAWQDALPDGFSATTTMTMAGLVEGHRVAWVETDYRRRLGRSKFHPIHDTARLTRQIVRTWLRFRRRAPL